MDISPNAERKHFYQLDSLRGLAAIAVAIHHWHIFWLLSPHSEHLALLMQVLPFRLFIAGHSSVMMFFVLSGFVLSLPQLAGRPVVYLQYLVKRVCRIYLPYLVALGVALLGCWQWHGQKTYGPWVDKVWSSSPQWRPVLQHILFLGTYDVAQYNPSFWTLAHEMRISIVFPVICAAVLWCDRKGGVALAFGFFLLSIGLEVSGVLSYSYGETLGYIGMFIFGILLAKYRVCLHDRAKLLSRSAYWGLFLAGILIYAYFPSLLNHWGIEFAAADALTAIGASIVILYSLISPKIDSFLLRRPILFLGRISYSLYLLHGTILFAMGHFFYGKTQPIVWLVPYLVLTIGCAALMYRAVEVPSIHLGKLLVARMGRFRSNSGVSGVPLDN